MYILSFSEIALRIKAKAKKQNITLKSLQKEAGVGINYINQMSQGVEPSASVIAAFAQILGCSTDYLLGLHNSDLTELSQEDQHLLELFHAISRDNQMLELGRMQLLSEQTKYSDSFLSVTHSTGDSTSDWQIPPMDTLNTVGDCCKVMLNGSVLLFQCGAGDASATPEELHQRLNEITSVYQYAMTLRAPQRVFDSLTAVMDVIRETYALVSAGRPAVDELEALRKKLVRANAKVPKGR